MQDARTEGDLIPHSATEVFYWKHNPESLLICVKVLAWYLGDGKERVTLPQYSWKMAARLLGLTGKRNNWVCPKWWKKRLIDYGIDPETFRIKNQMRFGIAWEMLNEYCVEGQPWKISVGTFNERLKAVESGAREWKRASIVSIPWTAKRRAAREPKKTWRGRAVTAAQARANIFSERVKAFRREFEEP